MDLDGTLYPGAHEEEPKAEKRGLVRNMEQVSLLEASNVPVIPATGNNVSMAQTKMLDPSCPSRKLRDLRRSPGIYCNGALVKGVGGREIHVAALGGFIGAFVDRWLAASEELRANKAIGGLAKEQTVFLRAPGLGPVGEQVGERFAAQMMIAPEDYAWLEPAAFVAEAGNILSLVIFTRPETSEQELLDLQQWLQTNELLQFGDATKLLSNGTGPGVVCKHLHVPGLGPEIDISPAGINKGSAISRLLTNPLESLGVNCSAGGSEIAVFGDAGNDVELFGMKRNATGTALEPLGPDFRPSIRVAMPWANDGLLIQDANVQATCDKVLAAIVRENPAVKKALEPS